MVIQQVNPLLKKKKKTQSNNISLHTLKLWESVVRVMVLIIFLIIDNNDIIANKNVYYIRIRIEWRKGRHRPHRGFSKTRSHRRSSQGACFTVNISQVFRGIPNSLLLKTKQISLSLSLVLSNLLMWKDKLGTREETRRSRDPNLQLYPSLFPLPFLVSGSCVPDDFH